MVKSKVVNQFVYPSKISRSSSYRLSFFPILRNTFINLNYRSLLYSYITKKSRFYPNRYKISCYQTGRGRAVLTNFHISRLAFKKYSIEGNLTGMSKIRW